jgi:hypothetical protein
MGINLDTITKDSLVSLEEVELHLDVIFPLLEDIGFRRITYCHGPDECGIDFHFEMHDFFVRVKYFGISVKKGKVTKGSAKIILSQLKEAFGHKFLISSPKTEVYLDGYYVIASGKITAPGKQHILETSRDFPYVDVIDGQELLWIIRNRKSLKDQYISRTNIYQSFEGEAEIIK